MHRILLREVVIDAPASSFEATRDFWSEALASPSEPVVEFPEFTALRTPAALCRVGLQNVGDAEPRYHLDIETDDVQAEVSRLVRLGAEKVAEGRTWTVMRDPSGHLFDVVPYESEGFEQRSIEVS